MLVLTRKVGEEIVIGERIKVRVVRIARGGVRIGIEAPPEIPVHRAEIAAKRHEADRAAAAGLMEVAGA